MRTAEWTFGLEQWLRQEAGIAGFDAAAVTPIRTPPDAGRKLTAERFTAWVQAGRAGEMEYLKRRDTQGVLLRSDVQRAIPWARSIIVCAFDYSAPGPLSIDPAPHDTGWIARYAWTGSRPGGKGNDRVDQGETGRGGACDANWEQDLVPTDYHDQLLTRLRHLESAVQGRLPCQSRCYVDTGPILERAAAAQAGIGWVGKNTCILNEQLGSWLLLGVIVTSIPVAVAFTSHDAADRCGSCTRCIDACPTAALVAPREMDATRCISYLNIEKKGAIAEELRPLMGRQVFGCDICQDVCPWNDKADRLRPVSGPLSSRRGMLLRGELINPELSWIASLDAASFKRYFKGSPLERTRRKRLLRNVAIAMGNSGRRQFAPTLERWAASLEEDPVLAEAAEWALGQIEQE